MKAGGCKATIEFLVPFCYQNSNGPAMITFLKDMILTKKKVKKLSIKG
jgi:hypothetical protein